MTFKNLRHSCRRIGASVMGCFHAKRDCADRCPERREMPLSSCCRGGRLRICRIEGDREQCAKMAAMGLYPGREAELIHPGACGGRCLLKIEDCSLCLDKSTSEGIMVAATEPRAHGRIRKISPR
ncbi:MAG: ferrous iron transport protein A [Desulfobulbaceae bacterium]|jgi:Fe2+ transport system protein FeoA|nr:ferrous iron transport protein A [Desulfobulbaceae bacterium]